MATGIASGGISARLFVSSRLRATGLRARGEEADLMLAALHADTRGGAGACRSGNRNGTGGQEACGKSNGGGTGSAVGEDPCEASNG